MPGIKVRIVNKVMLKANPKSGLSLSVSKQTMVIYSLSPNPEIAIGRFPKRILIGKLALNKRFALF